MKMGGEGGAGGLRHRVAQQESCYNLGVELSFAQRELYDGLADRHEDKAWVAGGVREGGQGGNGKRSGRTAVALAHQVQMNRGCKSEFGAKNKYCFAENGHDEERYGDGG